MAITRHETKVLWAASNSATVAPAGSQTSDIVTLDQTCFQARILLKADNSAGTPNAADIINFYVLETSGDPDGAGADEYATINHGILLWALDTSDDDPARAQTDLPVPQKGLTIYAEGITNTTVNNIEVSATITELRSS